MATSIVNQLWLINGWVATRERVGRYLVTGENGQDTNTNVVHQVNTQHPTGYINRILILQKHAVRKIYKSTNRVLDNIWEFNEINIVTLASCYIYENCIYVRWSNNIFVKYNDKKYYKEQTYISYR